MDNEHLSNNLNQANSLALVDVIEEMTADVLENFLQEEDYVGEVYIENNDLIIDHGYNVSHEMESPTNDQSLPDDFIDLLDSDDEGTRNEPMEDTISKIYRGILSHINYIQTPPNINMFPSYNETTFNELKNFISSKTPNEYVDPSRDCGISKYDDLLRLFIPNLWLNDLIIQQYIQLLIQNCNNNNVLNLGSFFFKDIDNHGFNGAIKKVLKQQKKKDLLDYNILLIPAHLDGNHWALIVANINKRKIYVYDSFAEPYKSLNENLHIFINFLNGEYLEEKLKLSCLEDFRWTIKTGLSPLQGNSHDCGVFVCTNARYHIFDVSINFDQGDIPLIRQRMCYELILNILLSTD